MLARNVMAAAIASLVLLFGAPKDALACHKGDPHGSATSCDVGGGDTLGALDCADGDVARLDPEGSGEWQCLSLRELKLALRAISYTVFLTSDGYSGDLVSEATALGFGGGTGLQAGDFICNIHAQSASLDGSYVAWLSDSITDAKDRLPIGSEPFVKVNGDLVALDIFDLLDGLLLVSPIDLDENDVFFSVPVWTGTFEDGFASSEHCDNWTHPGVDGSGINGLFGLSSALSGTWTDTSPIVCGALNHLYCFRE